MSSSERPPASTPGVTPADTPIKAVMIASRAGCPLVSVIRSPIFNTELLMGFIAAIGQFADWALQRIEEISIKGLDVELFVAFRHNLFILAALDKRAAQGRVREEAERALDVFYDQYRAKIEKWDGSASTFTEFEGILRQQIDRYLQGLASPSTDQKSGSLFGKMIAWLSGTARE